MLQFTRLGPIVTKTRVFTDASFGNQEHTTRSTGGRVVLVEDSSEERTNVISWKSNYP